MGQCTCACFSDGLPRMNVVILARLRRTPINQVVIRSDGSAHYHRTSYEVTTEKQVYRQIRESSKNKDLVLQFIKQDVHQLYFTATELTELVRVFKEHANTSTADFTSVMQQAEFMKIVSLNSTWGSKTQISSMVNALFDHFDSDGDGTLNLKEFLLGFSFWREMLSTSADKCLFAFTLFDKDRSGHMDREEFVQVIMYMLTASKPPSAKQDELSKQALGEFIDQVFSLADTDNSGALTVDELIDFSQRYPDIIANAGSTESALRAAFVLHDKDESNTLDKVEFMSMMRHTHVNSRMEDATLLALARKIVNEIFERVDTDASGSIEFDEFKDWMTHSPDASSNLLFNFTHGRKASDALMSVQSLAVSEHENRRSMDPADEIRDHSLVSVSLDDEATPHGRYSEQAPGKAQMESLRPKSMQTAAKKTVFVAKAAKPKRQGKLFSRSADSATSQDTASEQISASVMPRWASWNTGGPSSDSNEKSASTRALA